MQVIIKNLKYKMAKGFTLVEMAVVLVIVGLLLSSLIIPISAQLDQRDFARARAELQEAKEALMGYALINGHLPCPDTSVPSDGVADACPATTSSFTSGAIPWIELGVQPRDPWEQNYRYGVNGAFTVNFVLTTTGNGRVCTDSTCVATVASNVPVVIYSSGKNGRVAPTSNDELENASNDRSFVSHDFSNVTGAEFDDIVVWISANVLMNRMVAASKLP